jgi:signal transduction histidine kinase/ActR/RegA family two-component response regulator
MNALRKDHLEIEPAPATSLPAPETLERRVLILAPVGNDARLTRDFLCGTGLSAHVCRDPHDIIAEVSRGCGAIILAEEALADRAIGSLIHALKSQPNWSDIPIVLVTSGGEVGQTQLRRLALFGAGGNVILLERPFRQRTLLSTMEMALRARQRQYEARDSVAQLERAHAEIQAALRAKDDFLAALSHELRTPLNPVLLVASDRADNLDLPADVRADFELVRKSIELEARLIDDLLDLTRIARGKLSLDKKFWDIHAIVRDALTTVEDDIRQKQITVILDFTPEEKIVLGDAVRLQQIFWNILKNAAKFTPPGGEITIATRSRGEGGKISVEITDTGIGLTAEEIGHIFNAFSQGDHVGSGGSHRFGGLGLGLAISRKLVELHAGSIHAESAGRNQGATFIVELPMAVWERKNGYAPQTAKPLNAMPLRWENLENLHILLVEDHEPTRMALANLLNRRVNKVVLAVTVAEALEHARRESFDLVVSDIGLPDGNGYELMSELRDKFGLKGIALTGYGMEQDVARGLDAGFVAHLTKPVRVETLQKTLQEIIAGNLSRQ